MRTQSGNGSFASGRSRPRGAPGWAVRLRCCGIPVAALALIAVAVPAAGAMKSAVPQQPKAAVPRTQTAPPATKATRTPYREKKFLALQPPPPGGNAELTSFTPEGCVNVGDLATAGGVNLGISEQDLGYALGIQVNDETPIKVEVEKSNWSPTSITFVVPAAIGAAEWFAVGIIFESEFYAQLYPMNCAAYGGGGGGGGGYSFPSSSEEPAPAPAAVAKSARMLGPGGVDVTVALPPGAAGVGVEQPPPPGKPAIGGKVLALKALARRGLRKVNRECDLYAPHCPCCREDDSVCLEKERDNGDGTSTWVVRWRVGAQTADGRGAFTARSAEEDLEAVTALTCEPVGGAAGGEAGIARLNCR